MTHNKRKKISRARGSWTHGGGEKKKRRGAGHRGGRGKAGSGKKGDAKKPMYWKDTEYFGKHGFSSLNKNKEKTINITLLETIRHKLIEKGKATETGGTTKINLTQLKYDKLLGTGTPTTKYEITVKQASEKAIAKIQESGGKITLPNQDKSESKESEKQKE